MNTTSQGRITANRANAQKSTGPKTAAGKASSKLNATKHGILSREVLAAGEDHKELTALQEWFQEDLQPVGPMEIMLVGQIVATHWRLRRALAAESREVKREAASQQPSAKSHDLPPALEETAEGCRLVQTWLSETLLEVEQYGELTLATVGKFSARVGARSSSLKRNLLSLHIRQTMAQKQDGAEEGPLHEARKQAAVAFLQENLVQLAEREARCQQKEEKEAKARQTYAVLPSAEAMERLGRYESMLNRQLFRAMKELRTLQKERKGAEEQKTENSKSERDRRAESRRENLPNEATDEVENEEPRMENGLNTDKKLPNEPILASHPSQVSHPSAQTAGNLPNEAK